MVKHLGYMNLSPKKIFSILLVLFLIFPFFGNSFAETLRFAVVSPTINVRNATSETADIIHVIKTAGEYLILSESKDVNQKIWYKIKISSTLSGFIASWVIDSIRSSEKETPVTGKIAVIEPGVKIRLIPSLDGEIHQVVNELIEKQILSEIKDGDNRTWYKILLNDGKFGWVASWVIIVKAPKDEKKSASDKLIIAENINIRKGPGMGFEIVAHISTKVEARGIYESLDTEGKPWYLIRLPNNVEGWAASWVVEVKQYSENKKSVTGKIALIEPIVNVREGPSTQSKIVKTITVVSEFPILSQGNDINGKPWYEIQLDGNLKGWVASWVITVKISGNGNETIVPLNMRQGPGTNFEKLLEVPAYTAFSILGTAFNSNKDIWYAVILQGKTGWILGSQTKVSTKEEIDLTKIGTLIEIDASAVIDVYKGPNKTFIKKGTLTQKVNTFLVTGIAKNHTGDIWYSGKNATWEDFWVDVASLSKSIKVNPISPSKISSISWVKNPNGISLSFTFNDSLERIFESFNLTNPNRVVIDIKNALLFQQEFVELINSGGISQIRASQFSVNPNIVRVVLESSKVLKFTTRNDDKILLIDFSDYSTYQGPKLYINGTELENHLILKENKGNLYIPLYIFSNMVGGFLSWDKEKNEAVFQLAKKEYRFKPDTKFVYIAGENQQRINIQNPIAVLDNVLYIPLMDCRSIFSLQIHSIENSYYLDNQINQVRLDTQQSSMIYTLDFSLPIKFTDTVKQKQLTIRFENSILSQAIKLPSSDQFIRAISTKRTTNVPSASEFTFSMETLSQYETALLEETNQFIITFKKSGTKGLKGKKIILDPGHGSFEDGYYDCGAIGPTGTLESYINLQIALKLKSLLEKEGVIVLMTREQEQNKETLRLDQRVEFANKSGADLYISIHQNASYSQEAKGCEIFYYNDNSLEAGNFLLNSLSGNTGLVSRGNKKRGLAVTKEITTMPSLLIECAFLSNPEEEKMLQSEKFLDLVAEGISLGVKKFFDSF